MRLFWTASRCDVIPGHGVELFLFVLCQRAMRGRSVSMETMARGGASLPTSQSGGGLAHISNEVRSKVKLMEAN